MTARSKWRRLAAAGSACGLLATPAAAATLDWNDPPWPDPATRSFTYTVSTPSGPGPSSIDVDVDITDVNDVLQAGGTGSPSVSTATDLNPPSAGGAPNLFLKTNGNDGAGGNWVELDITFNYAPGVKEVSFGIFDVDEDQLILDFGFFQIPIISFDDEIEIWGYDRFGGEVDPTFSAVPATTPTWTDIGRTVSGDGPAASDSDDGTVLVDFGQSVLSALHIEYRNLHNPALLQWIGLSNITFSKAPEPGTGLLLLFGLTLLAGRRPRA